MKQFAEWLATTSPSVYIQNNNAWAIPAIQSIHIVGIAIVMGAVFMIYLRALGWAGMDQTLRENVNRFGPWLTWGLYLQLATGILMVIGEPVRELVTFSFWAKMFLVADMTLLAIAFQSSVRKHELRWEEAIKHRAVQGLMIFTFLIWAFIIVLGRLIAYDHVWGSWSPAAKA